ncbi:cyclic nucleotide-binding domain-containing protein [Nocardia terpenica]|uniref:ATP-binding protein n=1 Tax=Nocardia terpenica TaxID=455432 RepID=UPI001892FF13|nr:ATP-binding protein [Nocardia terpenica]MBF6066395.1 cyclic nucleotide-binding domain-containing protein [Nocardia terpenica]MBF6109471.1 cyclic nucleotide-binding domain-containing protein [Nocardia terpenica]MBF6112334.1 cyclic nucleotide-binding domain-containing protein [Nocardia terpenica]MBF6118957.1 cyclic nucleotide-binding domain-containing protein [Nocardia terpenica]MBF6157331.1 cyclic nucleotide-binding domain-containing protein [Nocardia terpenica]
MGTQLICDPDELRTLFLFEKLDDDQLAWLCRDGRVEHFEPGLVFREGDPATCFYVLMDGEVVLTKRSGGEEIELVRTSHRGSYSGAWSAYMGDKVDQSYTGSFYVTEPSRFFVLDAGTFARMMQEWFPMALHLLEGVFFGNRNANEIIGQRERLLALGSLSAGLTHELNNPAAAAVRATASLRDRVAGMRHKLKMMAHGKFDSAALEALVQLQEEAATQVAKAPTLTPMEAADREDELGDWLENHGIANGWDIAPTFVQAGFDIDWLEKVAATLEGCDGGVFEGAIRWLNYTVETELLMSEITDSTTRISSLVDAAKQYSQMDRAPFQVVDLHELLDSTLVMLARKIGDGITVVKEYDRALPQVPCYPAELNQVWTNLIDNAVAAMDGRGTLTVRTYRENDCAAVEVCDTGSGVPPEIRNRIFEPFFTTKPVGEGTGLGLDISFRIVVNKHGGDIRVESEPGDTRFVVRLPLNPTNHAAQPNPEVQ